MRQTRSLRRFGLRGALALAAWATACGAPNNRYDSGPDAGLASRDAAGDDAGTLDEGYVPLGPPGAVDGATPRACVGLQCQQHACASGGSTTISGTIYDPAGKNPLYDVVVYVPNSAVAPLKSGASCDACDALYTGDPIATALTDAAGKFTLTNAPDGSKIPLVIQIGKWRKQITIPHVTGCQDNPQPDRSLTLPKNRAEGDIPNIAISTGSADTLECLLRRVGLDAAEYGAGAGGAGRIHIFQGSGGGAPDTSPSAPASSASLWDSKGDLMGYDMVLLSCEGGETGSMNQQALHDYASAGGRVFASHFHYAWFNSGPYASENLATWTPGTNTMPGATNGSIVTTLPNGQPFAKGVALAQWLGNVGALTAGELPIQDAKHNADVALANTPSQAWIVSDAHAKPANATEYLSFNTPTNAPMGDAGAPNYCGRVVFSDLHVGAASGDYALGSSPYVPGGCAGKDLSPQEKALEFMLFDLSSCVTPESVPPSPPPPRPPPPH